MSGRDIHPTASIHETAAIFGDDIVISEGVKIDRDVVIGASKVRLGANVHVKRGTELGFENYASGSELIIGDETIIFENIRASIPVLHIGDYGRIHEKVVFYGNKICSIGHNCWVGQLTVLNSKDELIIGDNFRVGVQSQIWTHVASGELIEGCKIYNVEKTIIGNSVWLVGHCIVSPGVTIADRTVVLPGAVLSKDTEAGHCYAGIPTRDITDKYNPYTEVTLGDRFTMMEEWVAEFIGQYPKFEDKIRVRSSYEGTLPDHDQVLFTVGLTKELAESCAGTICDIQSKFYTKRRSPTELAILKNLLGHKARFVPLVE